MRTHSTRLSSLDTSPTVETVEQFLARGGRIQKCAPNVARGPSMYTPTIAIDGYELPVNIGTPEYIPNFVRDLTTYDEAQRDCVSMVDDGSVSVVRDDVSRVMRPSMRWRTTYNARCAREGADVMEEVL